jgi:hemerythrin superfamily protein
MSIVDDVRDAFTPSLSDKDRADARSKARAAAGVGDWLSQILDHHVIIESAFAAALAAGDADNRTAALKRLGLVLTGHANAEESVIYPAMAETGQKGHAGHGYDEQATVKMEMAAIEKIDPMARDFTDRLEEIRDAVAHHMYEEESRWFPELRNSAPAADQAMMARRYKEEFSRYAGTDPAALSF